MSASVLVNDSTSTNLVEQATQQVYSLLTAFATDNEFEDKVTLAFGEGFNTEQLETLRQQWLVGDFAAFPPIEIRSSAELNGANGAFAAATNTIYLSAEYLEENEENLEAIADVVLEEYGHFVDAEINELDAAGDEGDIFSQLVQGIEIDESAIQGMKTEDDTTTVVLGEQILEIEQANAPRPILIVPGIVGTLGKDYESWLVNRSPEPTDLQIDPLLNVYDDLIQTLENVGYVQDKTLFVANYDWRLNPGPTDGKIDGKVDGITAQSITDNQYEYGVDYLGYWLNKAKEQGATEVDIIAHSTGGLLTRTYLQSDAYGQDGLPKVNNFFMLGVPNRGASKAWNILQNNFSFDSSFRLVISDVIDDAYQHVKNGGTIAGPEDITADDIKGEKDFISAYVPTVQSLLSTYDFIQVNGNEITSQEKCELCDINKGLTFEYPDSSLSLFEVIETEKRNSFLLDLNNGLDLEFSPFENNAKDPNLFTDKVSGQVFNIFGFDRETATTVQPFVGNQFGFSDGIFPFTKRGLLARSPRLGELWYQDIETESSKPFQIIEDSDDFFQGGDGTVPLISSIGQFYTAKKDGDTDVIVTDERVILKPFDEVTHTRMVSDQDVQKYILDQLNLDYEKSKISTNLVGGDAGALINASRQGILGFEDYFFGTIVTFADLLNPVNLIEGSYSRHSITFFKFLRSTKLFKFIKYNTGFFYLICNNTSSLKFFRDYRKFDIRYFGDISTSLGRSTSKLRCNSIC